MRVKAKQFKVYNNGIEEQILALRGEDGAGADLSAYALKSEIPDISGKQDKIADLQSIRDNVSITNSLTESTENNMISAINLYKVGDCAVWDNKLWRTIMVHRGQMPYEGSQYWERLSLKSLANDLDSVRTGAARGASTFGDSSGWSSGTAYQTGDYAIFDNKLWKAKMSTKGIEPFESIYWTQVSLKSLSSEITRLSNIQPDYYCNPNLLDNWYFGNPVNQRGQTSYTGGQTYSVDRWALNYETGLSVNSGYALITGSWGLTQQLSTPTETGRTLTISALISDLSSSKLRIGCSATNTFASGTEWYKDFTQADIGSGKTLISYTFNPTSAIKCAYLSMINSGDVLRYRLYAVKLEYGNKQTLAHIENDQWVLNDIPDFEEQLRKCQRYYWAFKSTFNLTKYQSDGNKYIGVLQFPTEMHSNPSITYTTGSGTVQQVSANKQRIEFVGQAPASNVSCYVDNIVAVVAGYGG